MMGDLASDQRHGARRAVRRSPGSSLPLALLVRRRHAVTRRLTAAVRLTPLDRGALCLCARAARRRCVARALRLPRADRRADHRSGDAERGDRSVRAGPWLGEPLWRLTGVRPGLLFPLQMGLRAPRRAGQCRPRVAVCQLRRQPDGTHAVAALACCSSSGWPALAAVWTLTQADGHARHGDAGMTRAAAAVGTGVQSVCGSPLRRGPTADRPFRSSPRCEPAPYMVSIWTDPDTTDDGTPGGQFWIT